MADLSNDPTYGNVPVRSGFDFAEGEAKPSDVDWETAHLYKDEDGKPAGIDAPKKAAKKASA